MKTSTKKIFHPQYINRQSKDAYSVPKNTWASDPRCSPPATLPRVPPRRLLPPPEVHKLDPVQSSEHIVQTFSYCFIRASIRDVLRPVSYLSLFNFFFRSATFQCICDIIPQAIFCILWSQLFVWQSLMSCSSVAADPGEAYLEPRAKLSPQFLRSFETEK